MGLGLVTPMGVGKDEFWKYFIAGKTGITRVTRFDPDGYSCNVAAEVKNFNPSDFVDNKTAKRKHQYALYAIAVSKLAIEDAKLGDEIQPYPLVLVLIGSGIGGISIISY